MPWYYQCKFLYGVHVFCYQIDPNTDASTQQKDMIEQAAQQVAQDNTELACVFIQKSAIEKAIPDIDKRLATVCFFPFCCL